MSETSWSQMNTRQIHSILMSTLDSSTVDFIVRMFDDKVIKDYSEDGWVLFGNEWIPVETFKERYNRHEY